MCARPSDACPTFRSLVPLYEVNAGKETGPVSQYMALYQIHLFTDATIGHVSAIWT